MKSWFGIFYAAIILHTPCGSICEFRWWNRGDICFLLLKQRSREFQMFCWVGRWWNFCGEIMRSLWLFKEDPRKFIANVLNLNIVWIKSTHLIWIELKSKSICIVICSSIEKQLTSFASLKCKQFSIYPNSTLIAFEDSLTFNFSWKI